MKLYNSGSKPVVWENNPRTGKMVLHPGKSDVFGEKKSAELQKAHKELVTESEYKKASEPKKAAQKAPEASEE